MSRLLERAEIDRQLEDLPEWHCFAGALRARYAAAGFPAAVALLAEIADVAEEVDHHPDLDLRFARLDVVLWTHTAGGVTQRDVELAHRLSAVAAQASAAAETPPMRRVEVEIECQDPVALLPFWRAGLGLRERATEHGATLRDPSGRLPTTRLTRSPGPGGSRTRLEVHLPATQAAQRAGEVVAAGGRVVSDEHAPRWWLLADPDGNELRVCAEGVS